MTRRVIPLTLAQYNALPGTHYFQSEWESALSDLKAAAVASGHVLVYQADGWDIRHGTDGSHEFGYHTGTGGFQRVAHVNGPDALRNLRTVLDFGKLS